MNVFRLVWEGYPVEPGADCSVAWLYLAQHEDFDQASWRLSMLRQFVGIAQEGVHKCREVLQTISSQRWGDWVILCRLSDHWSVPDSAPWQIGFKGAGGVGTRGGVSAINADKTMLQGGMAKPNGLCKATSCSSCSWMGRFLLVPQWGTFLHKILVNVEFAPRVSANVGLMKVVWWKKRAEQAQHHSARFQHIGENQDRRQAVGGPQ